MGIKHRQPGPALTVMLDGGGGYQYEEHPGDWGRLPEGMTLREVADVIVDRQDRVHVLTRGPHAIIVFDASGEYLYCWGEGIFARPHGATLGEGDTLWCVDDEGHGIYHCSLAGEVLRTIGTPGQVAPAQSGRPFNKPTKLAVHPVSGELFVADGYGNARVHRYSPTGEHILSWGESGCEAGQFNLPHSIAADSRGRILVADRENHRVQIFDEDGNHISQWTNIHRPCAFHIDGDVAYIGQLPSHLPVNATYPRIGACVTIHDLDGQQQARLGADFPGEDPGQFTAPHGIACTQAGDLFVGEVSFSAWGSRLPVPRTARCLRKLTRV